MTAAILGMGVFLVACGLLPSTAFWVFAVLSALMGLSSPFFNSLFMALLQEKVEPEYLGRVLGLSNAIMTLASPIGLVATALFAGRTGITVWFLAAGLVTLAVGALAILLPSVRNCDK
jgi:H+ antiporter protein